MTYSCRVCPISFQIVRFVNMISDKIMKISNWIVGLCSELGRLIWLLAMKSFYDKQITCASDKTMNPEITKADFFHENEFFVFSKSYDFLLIRMNLFLSFFNLFWFSSRNTFCADQNKLQVSWNKFTIRRCRIGWKGRQ